MKTEIIKTNSKNVQELIDQIIDSFKLPKYEIKTGRKYRYFNALPILSGFGIGSDDEYEYSIWIKENIEKENPFYRNGFKGSYSILKRSKSNPTNSGFHHYEYFNENPTIEDFKQNFSDHFTPNFKEEISKYFLVRYNFDYKEEISK